jgi:hypothetical protein
MMSKYVMSQKNCELFEMLVWAYILGQCQKDLKECSDVVEEYINLPDFDLNDPKNAKLIKVHHALELISVQMNP